MNALMPTGDLCGVIEVNNKTLNTKTITVQTKTMPACWLISTLLIRVAARSLWLTGSQCVYFCEITLWLSTMPHSRQIVKHYEHCEEFPQNETEITLSAK